MIRRIREQLDQLPRAERQVAQAVLDAPDRTIHENIASLAQRSGVSEPTVIRFCRSLGVDGFRALKLEIARAVERNEAVIHEDIEGDEPTGVLIDKVVSRATFDLDRVRATLDANAVERAVGLLADAACVEFWGLGASGLVAADAQNKFFRLRMPCVSYTDGPTILQSAAIRGAGDVIIAVSNAGRSSLLNEACATARTNGARVIAITATGTPLARTADVLLAVDVEEDENRYTPRSSRLAHLLTIDIVQVALAIRLGPTAARHLRATKSALRSLRQSDDQDLP